jgi:hypothetical protein
MMPERISSQRIAKNGGGSSCGGDDDKDDGQASSACGRGHHDTVARDNHRLV